MPRTRLKVAMDVREAFIAAERAAEQSAAATARCVAVLLEARAEAKLAPTAGLEITQRVSESSRNAMEAARLMLGAHPLLADMGRDLKVIGYGPDGQCSPNEPSAGASSLRVVSFGA